MHSMIPPEEVPISVKGARELSLECWRLGRLAESLKDHSEGPALRHAVRRITETLNSMGIEWVDFAGRAYDAGLVPEVIEVREDPALRDSQAIIEETIAPTVTWRGLVIMPGQILVKRSPIKSDEHSEVNK